MQRDPMVTFECQLFGKDTSGEQQTQAIVSRSAFRVFTVYQQLLLQVAAAADAAAGPTRSYARGSLSGTLAELLRRSLQFLRPERSTPLDRTSSEQKRRQSYSLRQVLQRCTALTLWVQWGCRLLGVCCFILCLCYHAQAGAGLCVRRCHSLLCLDCSMLKSLMLLRTAMLGAAAGPFACAATDYCAWQLVQASMLGCWCRLLCLAAGAGSCAWLPVQARVLG
jgi:hypothetical protein